MTGAAVRSRLLELRQERQAARSGRDLLDGKREAILRELLARVRRRDTVRHEATLAHEEADRALQEARVELGANSLDAAVLAQPITASVERQPWSVVGVPTPRLQGRLTPFKPHYGTAGTAATLDAAGERFSALLPRLITWAEEEEAVRNLQDGLKRTVRRLQALEKVVIPKLERDIREVTAALEEEERDEAFRRKCWLGAHRDAVPGA
jgi:V/A-type H+-transporting ATPase subunit D